MHVSRDEALAFLRRHQPLGPDADLTRADLEELDAVRRYLAANPMPEALDLLLGIFGEGSGFGVYQLIEDTVAAYDRSQVVPLLARKLMNGPRSVRYWCAQIAMGYPDASLAEALGRNLEPGDYDLRYAAVAVLVAIGTTQAREALANWLPDETDEELREIIEAALGR